MRAFLNGRYVDDAQALVPVTDRGLLYGDGLFETLRARGGKLPWWERHFARLRAGAEFLRLALPFSSEEARAAAESLLTEGGPGVAGADAVVRITVTRGTGPRGYSIHGAVCPTFLITTHPAPPPPGPLLLHTCSIRIAANDPLRRFKTTNQLLGVLARAEAEEHGANEALLLNTEGFVAEAAASNVFWLARDVLTTPTLATGALPGIARAVLLESGHHEGLAVTELAATPFVLHQAEGIFLCNSVTGLVPVAGWDGEPVRQSPRFESLNELLASTWT